MSEAITKENIGSLGALLAVVDQAALDLWLSTQADQDVAAALDLLDVDSCLVLLRRLPPDRAPDIFSHLNGERQRLLFDHLAEDEKVRIVGELSYDDAAALLDELPDEHTEQIIDLLPPEDKRVIQSLLTWPEESVGRLMTPEYIAVRPEWTIACALDYVRTHSERGETANTIYVTDEQGHLMGAVNLRDLLLAGPMRTLQSLLREDAVTIEVTADQEEAAHIIRHYDLESLPVVDASGLILGIVTVDDVFDIAEEESTEDFHKLGAVGPLDLGLMDASPGLLYRKRVGWLVILVFVNIFSGAAIAVYETAIEAVVALVFFLPLVIASGGNAGAQSATLMVRALATGDVQARDWFRLWGKELAVSAGLGSAMGAAVWWAAAWIGGIDIGNVVALSMVLVVVFGSMIGMITPFILIRMKVDPATASAPLITSIADVVGVLLYFSVAIAILSL